MSSIRRQAGQNIRAMAARRRTKAILSFTTAGLTVILPIWLIHSIKEFMRELLPSANFNIPIYVYAFIGITALASLSNGLYLWKRANHADQGARGEEDIALLLSDLEREGWQIEYGLMLKNRKGDVDIVCQSPSDRTYIIDVKSHRGIVSSDYLLCQAHPAIWFEPISSNQNLAR